MKKISVTCCLGLLITLTACVDFDEYGPPYPNMSTQQPIAGGITPVNNYQADVMTAARFAASQLGSQLASVNSAAKQVVAGINYHLTITLANQSVYQVVVYQNLQNQFQLTSSNMITTVKPPLPRCDNGYRWSPKKQMCLIPMKESPDGRVTCATYNDYYFDEDTNTCQKLFKP